MTILIVLAAVLWIMCSIAAFVIDRRDFPDGVDPVGDALMSATLLLSGPCGLAGILLMGAGRK